MVLLEEFKLIPTHCSFKEHPSQPTCEHFSGKVFSENFKNDVFFFFSLSASGLFVIAALKITAVVWGIRTNTVSFRQWELSWRLVQVWTLLPVSEHSDKMENITNSKFFSNFLFKGDDNQSKHGILRSVYHLQSRWGNPGCWLEEWRIPPTHCSNHEHVGQEERA